MYVSLCSGSSSLFHSARIYRSSVQPAHSSAVAASSIVVHHHQPVTRVIARLRLADPITNHVSDWYLIVTDEYAVLGRCSSLCTTTNEHTLLRKQARGIDSRLIKKGRRTSHYTRDKHRPVYAASAACRCRHYYTCQRAT